MTFTDDIILDGTPPVVETASLITSGGTSPSTRSVLSDDRSVSSAARRETKFRIRLRARDRTSGVVAVQAARSLPTRGPVIRVANEGPG